MIVFNTFAWYNPKCIGIPDFCPEKQKKNEGTVNKFAKWMASNDKKQRAVAEKLGISTSTIHDIIRNGQIPSLKLAYEIEKYTKGAITVYDWIDELLQSEMKKPKSSKVND